MSACAIDGSPTGDGSQLCSAHRNRLEQRIAEMPALARELELTLTRQTSAGERNGGRSAEKPLPYDAGASDAQTLLHGTLTGLVRDLRGTDTWPINITIPGLGYWLRAHIDRFVQSDAAGDMYGELDYATRQAWRAIARSPYRSRVKVGPCPLDHDTGPCRGHILALIPIDPTQTSIMICVVCGGSWTPDRWLLAGRMILDRKEAS